LANAPSPIPCGGEGGARRPPGVSAAQALLWHPTAPHVVIAAAQTLLTFHRPRPL